MKKKLFAAFLSVILLMQTLPVFAAGEAGAEVTLTLVEGAVDFGNDYNSIDTVDDLPYLKIKTDTGYGLITVDGTPVTEPVYTNSMNAKYNYIEVTMNLEGYNHQGLLAWDGSEVMACEYGDLKILNQYWGLGIALKACSADNYDYKGWSGDSFFMIDYVDVYWLPSASVVAKLTRDEYLDAEDAGRNIYIQDHSEVIRAYDSSFNLIAENLKSLYTSDYSDPDTYEFKDNGHRGLMDRDGNILIPALFSSLGTGRGDYYSVYNGEKYGLIEVGTGNVIVPAEYDKVEYTYYAPYAQENGNSYSYVSGKYIIVVKDGKLGYVDMEGNVTCEPKYSSNVIQDKYGAVLCYSDLEGAMHFLAGDGVDTTLPSFDRLYALYGGSGFLFKVRDEKGYGVIDWHGNALIETSEDIFSVDMTGDGQYILITKYSDRKYSFELYEVSYPFDEKDEQQGGSEESSVEPEISQSGEESSVPEESSVIEENSGSESAGIDKTAVSALINSIITLLKADASANQVTVGTLLDIVMTSCVSDETLTTLLSTAKTLMAVDAGSAITILESVVTLLK